MTPASNKPAELTSRLLINRLLTSRRRSRALATVLEVPVGPVRLVPPVSRAQLERREQLAAVPAVRVPAPADPLADVTPA